MTTTRAARSEAFQALRERYSERFDAASDYTARIIEKLERGVPLTDFRDDLLRFAHTLSGTAGSFGYGTISRCAGELERLLDSTEADSEDGTALLNRIQFLRRALDKRQIDYALRADERRDPSRRPDRQGRVLIVEDGDTLSELIAVALGDEAEMKFAADARRAADAVRQVKYDLIVLHDGPDDSRSLDLITTVRQSARNAATPIFFVAGQSENRALEQALECGATDAIGRPFAVEAFAERIETLLERADKTVMLVDDDSSVRELLALEFRRQGFNVIEAKNGTEAIRMLACARPDAVVLDRIMPAVGGAAVLQELRRSRNKRDIPVIVLTGRSNATDSVNWMRRGATDLLTKPFDAEHVVSRTVRAMAPDFVA